MNLFASLVAGSLASTAPSGDGEPTGPWQIDYGTTNCTLSRSFKRADDNIVVRIIPALTTERVHFEFEASGQVRGFGRSGTYALTLDGKPAGEARYTSISLETGAGWRAKASTIEKLNLTALFDARQWHFLFGNKNGVSVMAGPSEIPLKAARTCLRDLATSFGYDVAYIGKMTRPPEYLGASSFVSFDDYPAESLNRGEEGVATIVWTVDVDGRAKNCRVVESSGHSALDQAACRAVYLRGRFEPARDSSGNALPVPMMHRVDWNIR